jgi:hypothetical protein
LIAIGRDALHELYRTHRHGPHSWGETRMVYEVHAQWGKRFDVWDGMVTKKVQDGPIMEPSGAVRTRDR